MKKNTGYLFIVVVLAGLLAASCNKKDAKLDPVETYKLTGRIDATRTTIATAGLTSAVFTISYNNANSFGDAQSIFNGTLTLSGYSGITGKDTLSFFATQASGPAISYITVANTAVNTTNTTKIYTYFNGTAASFSATNFPFANDITSALKEGKSYFRIGQYPKYVYILLDNVVKL